METNKRSIRATATLAFPSVGAAGAEDLTVPVNGAKVGQPVVIGCGTLEDGLSVSGFVGAAGVVTVRVTNATAGAIDPADTHSFQIAVL